MKPKSKSRKLLSLLALILIMAMALTSAGFAADTAKSADHQDELPAYMTTEDGGIMLTPNSTEFVQYRYAVTEDGGIALVSGSTTSASYYQNTGCPLDYLGATDPNLQWLRLTFNDAYSLKYETEVAANDNSADTVLKSYYRDYGTLERALSAATINRCKGNDGVDLLTNLQGTYEYRTDRTVRYLVDSCLYNLEECTAPRLRLGLKYFFPESMLGSMKLQELQALADIVLATPEYKAFYNSLYGHDCNLVNTWIRQGYSTDVILRTYANQAESAVKTIWPDYLDKVDQFKRTYK